jgi:flagellar biosynthesis protein FlhF
MKVRRFFAPDMRQAIRLVRDAQGPDAVILSNRKIDGGVEIIAATDYDVNLLKGHAPAPASESASSGTEDLESDSANKETATKISPAADAATEREHVDWSQDPAIVSMRNEIRQLRGLLENQLAHLAWGEMNRNDPQQTEVMRRFTRMELDSDLVAGLTKDADGLTDTSRNWELALEQLASTVPVVEQDFMDQGGIVALIGSTGVGKTTSVAKLAARYVLRYGQRHVALVTTDSYRIGAHDQLMTYGRLLGIPVQVASDHKELRSALESLSDKRLVLIDTAGMSQRDLRLSEQFATLSDSGIAIRTLLVLSATQHTSVIDETVRAFSSVPLDGAILTKMDEAACLGGALSVIIKQHLPLVFTANGQRVPEDLHPARARDLVQQAAALAADRELPAESILAERFGGLQANVHV